MNKVKIDSSIRTIGDLGSDKLNMLCLEHEKKKLFRLAINISARITEDRLGLNTGTIKDLQPENVILGDLHKAVNTVVGPSLHREPNVEYVIA